MLSITVTSCCLQGLQVSVRRVKREFSSIESTKWTVIMKPARRFSNLQVVQSTVAICVLFLTSGVFLITKTNRDRKTQFDNRLARFAQCGYKVEVMWECEWKDLKERDESVRLQLEEIADETYKREPIIPRDALFGGRTEVFAMFFEASMQVDGKKGKMVDINSMYPHVMDSGKMPLDHPTVKVGPPSRFDTSPDVYFGLVKAKVYPPRGLFFFLFYLPGFSFLMEILS